MDEKFFVLSDCESPFQIVFDRKIAFTIGAAYVDSFGQSGNHIQAYKLIDEEKKEYTTDF